MNIMYAHTNIQNRPHAFQTSLGPGPCLDAARALPFPLSLGPGRCLGLAWALVGYMYVYAIFKYV